MARPPGPSGADPRDTPEVVRSLVDNTQLLVKKEIELAKLEIKEIVTARVMAVAFLAIAGVLGLYLGAFALVTIAKALELVVAEWLAWLIVTGIVLLMVVVLLLLAKRKLQKPSNSPDTTKADVQETIELAKGAKEKVQL
ncbi:MAG: phage holin family protein [Nitriliruptor sp.]